MLENGTAVRCLNFVQKDDKMYIIGREFCNPREIFSNPISSLRVDCFLSSKSKEIGHWKVDNMSIKVCTITYNSEFSIIPLLHGN